MTVDDYPVEGSCDERFTKVRNTFVRNFAEDLELGSAFAVSVDGEMAVDLWGGYTDVNRTKAWIEDTIVAVSSSSKIPVSLCGLLLLDRGLIALDEPVATYWPEFAANGKESLPVRYLFCHAAGLPLVKGQPGMEVICDFDELTGRLAAEKPWWTPGKYNGYHGISFGNLIGELVRRTTGRRIAQFFRDEIAEPLNIDFSFGLSPSDAPRLAEIEHAVEEPLEVPEDSVYYQSMGYLEAQSMPEVWLLDMPAGNGVTNARALAQIGSLLAMQGVAGGQRVFTEETAQHIWQEQSYTVDLTFGEPVRYGLGFGLASSEFPLPWEHAFHWGGRGGSSVIMIPEIRAAIAYTPSKFYQGRGTFDARGTPLREAAIECLLAL